MAHGPQVNSVNGDNLIALVQGRPVPHGLISLEQHPITPNQAVEAAVVQCWYYVLTAPDPGKAKLAIDRLTALIKEQMAQGFMRCAGSNEFMAGSGHLAIWLRAMTGALLFADRAAVLKGSWLPGLLGLLRWWWASWHAVCRTGLVPSGPLAGRVVLPGPRRPKGEEAGNAVNAAVLQLASGGKLATKGLNTRSLTLDPRKPDNAAVALANMVRKGPGFGSGLMTGALPRLAVALTIERGTAGHVATFAESLPGDGATSVWVAYATGEYRFDGGPPPFDHAAEVIRMDAA